MVLQMKDYVKEYSNSDRDVTIEWLLSFLFLHSICSRTGSKVAS